MTAKIFKGPLWQEIHNVHKRLQLGNTRLDVHRELRNHILSKDKQTKKQTLNTKQKLGGGRLWGMETI